MSFNATNSWTDSAGVMEFLGIRSASTLTRYIHVLGMPAHRRGKAYRYDLAEIEEWLRSAPGDAGSDWIDPAPGQTGSPGSNLVA